jgi:hypothetical protein
VPCRTRRKHLDDLLVRVDAVELPGLHNKHVAAAIAGLEQNLVLLEQLRLQVCHQIVQHVIRQPL